MNYTKIVGNLGENPVTRIALVKGEDKKVVEFNVMVARYRYDDDKKETVQVGGFWVKVNAWGGLGEHAARVLRKGMRVAVMGELVENFYENAEGKQFGMQMNAEEFYLHPSRIKEVVMMPKRNAADTSSPQSASSAAVPASF